MKLLFRTLPTKFILISLVLLFSLKEVHSQKTMDAWNDLLDKKEFADYFSGMFNNLGIIVHETGERFMVLHKGDHFELKEGINKDETDYIVTLELHNFTTS
jgi:hypothetical protein